MNFKWRSKKKNYTPFCFQSSLVVIGQRKNALPWPKRQFDLPRPSTSSHCVNKHEIEIPTRDCWFKCDKVVIVEMNPSSSNSRGRVSKGRHCTTMANGDTTNRTTSSKFNKNNNQDATTTSVNHSTNTNTASNRVNSSNSAEKATSGPGGRIRRRSAPPVALEGTGMQRFLHPFVPLWFCDPENVANCSRKSCSEK